MKEKFPLCGCGKYVTKPHNKYILGHHIDPVSQEPFFANDPDSCITLCKECHKQIHMNIEGCKYHELRKC